MYIEQSRDLACGQPSNNGQEQTQAESIRELCQRVPDDIAFSNDLSRVIGGASHTIPGRLHRNGALTCQFTFVLFLPLLAQGRKWHKAHEVAPSALHPHHVDSDLQKPGFGVKVCAARLPRNLDSSQCL